MIRIPSRHNEIVAGSSVWIIIPFDLFDLRDSLGLLAQYIAMVEEAAVLTVGGLMFQRTLVQKLESYTVYKKTRNSIDQLS